MTITIDVPPDMAARLSTEADRQGKDVPEVVRGLLEQRFAARPPQSYDPAAALAALDSFDEGDEEEQRETLNTLGTTTVHDVGARFIAPSFPAAPFSPALPFFPAYKSRLSRECGRLP